MGLYGGFVMLNRDDILKISDLITETVSVPEWDGDVLVRAMTGVERDEFEQAVFPNGQKDFANIRARLCSLSIVDENGRRLFEDADLVNLGEKNAKALDKVFAVAKRLSGIGKTEMDALKKNLKTAHLDDSSSS